MFEIKFSGGKRDSKNSKRTPSLHNDNADYSRIVRLLRDAGAIGKNGITARQITDEFNKLYNTEKTIFAIGAKLGRLVAKKLIIARLAPNERRIMLYSLPIEK